MKGVNADVRSGLGVEPDRLRSRRQIEPPQLLAIEINNRAVVAQQLNAGVVEAGNVVGEPMAEVVSDARGLGSSTLEKRGFVGVSEAELAVAGGPEAIRKTRQQPRGTQIRGA